MNSRDDHERNFGLFAISVAIHVFIFVALGLAPSAGEAILMHNLEFEVLDPQEMESEEEPELEEPEPEEPPEEPKRVKPKPSRKVIEKKEPEASPEPPPKTDTPPPPEAQEPIEFPGVTLTSEDGVGSWSTVTGSGKSFKGPIKVPKGNRQTETTGSIDGVEGGTGSASIFSKKDLSRSPVEPQNMDQILLKNYPLQARKQGIEGYAIMRVRILRDGSVDRITTVKETFDGFSKACEKTLKSARWQPRLNKRGRPIASDITYTCRFEVGY